MRNPALFMERYDRMADQFVPALRKSAEEMVKDGYREAAIIAEQILEARAGIER